MPLTPQDIVGKEFREAVRGYRQADVDLFLDEVVEEFARVYEDNQKLRVRLAALQQEVARMREGTVEPAPQPTGSADVEDEVRARIRAFLSDQLRALDRRPAPPSTTVERIARDLTKTASPPVPQQPSVSQPQGSRPVDRGNEQEGARRAPADGEPFWAGE